MKKVSVLVALPPGRNPYAELLRGPQFRKQVVRQGKGRASYTRKGRSRKGDPFGILGAETLQASPCNCAT